MPKINRIAATDFVTAFMEVYRNDGTTKDLCEKLGADSKHVTNYRSQLQKRGVNLPKLRRDYPDSINKVDVNSLNAIIAASMSEDVK